MIYDKEYFIKKFEAIPEEEWCVGGFSDGLGAFCALGHCGCLNGYQTNEGLSLRLLISHNNSFGIVRLNDGSISEVYKYGNTPKMRIINFLKQL